MEDSVCKMSCVTVSRTWSRIMCHSAMVMVTIMCVIQLCHSVILYLGHLGPVMLRCQTQR